MPIASLSFPRCVARIRKPGIAFLRDEVTLPSDSSCRFQTLTEPLRCARDFFLIEQVVDSIWQNNVHVKSYICRQGWTEQIEGVVEPLAKRKSAPRRRSRKRARPCGSACKGVRCQYLAGYRLNADAMCHPWHRMSQPTSRRQVSNLSKTPQCSKNAQGPASRLQECPRSSFQAPGPVSNGSLIISGEGSTASGAGSQIFTGYTATCGCIFCSVSANMCGSSE